MRLWPKGKIGKAKRQEHRRYSRISNSLRISYQVASDAQHSNCRSTDISEGGIRFNLFQKLETGTTLKLWIYLQDLAEPLLVFGKVTWIRETPGKEFPYEAGIEFELFDPSFRDKIQNHIKSISIE